MTSLYNWRTLTNNEWEHLLSTRTVNNGTGQGYSYEVVSNGTIDGIPVNTGLFLFPDGFTQQNDWRDVYKTWVEIFKAGIVFLPAAGAKDNYQGECRYWTSTSHATYDNYAFFVKLSGEINKTLEVTSCRRDIKQSVRLVTDVN